MRALARSNPAHPGTIRGDADEAVPARGGAGAQDWEAHAATYGHRIVVHLLARGLSLDDAVDVAQATWARLLALDRAGRLPFVQMPGLALQQARYLASTLQRDRSAREQLGDVEDVELRVVDDRADAEHCTVARDRVERAVAEIDKLSPSARAVFRRVLGDPPPSHKEIALDVGLSEQRVRQIVCETRARLRRALDEEAEVAS